MKKKDSKNALDNLVEAKPMDLQQCFTIGDIVKAMYHCGAGAQMLGETARTLMEFIESSKKPDIVYDGPRGHLYDRLYQMVRERWCRSIKTSDEYVSNWSHTTTDRPTIIVGIWPERNSKAIFSSGRRTIYINQYGWAKPGQYNDGYYPDCCFMDPAFAINILFLALCEWVKGSTTNCTELMEILPRYGGFSAEIAQGAETALTMFTDRSTTTFMTLTGIMTVAQMGLLIHDMFDQNMVDFCAATGALMGHGLIQGTGLKHWKHDPKIPDRVLAENGINRISTLYEPESNFDHIEHILNAVLEKIPGHRAISPSIFHRKIGEYLAEEYPDNRAILAAAFKRNIPVCTPAFFDSEMGNDVHTHNILREKSGRPRVRFDLEKDNDLLVKFATKSKRMGIFTIGGGVPRNWVQNIAPLLHLIRRRTARKVPLRNFFYGMRIDPTRPWYMNLSGCTYSEGGTWLKFDFDGKQTEITGCATLAWPFILKYLAENMKKPRKPHTIDW